MKSTITVMVHRERQISHAVAGASRASGRSSLGAARTAAAHYFGVPEQRVTVEPTIVGDDSAVMQAVLQPASNPIAWGMLKWALAGLAVALFCWIIWEGRA